MSKVLISVYKNIHDNKSTQALDISSFLTYIKDGKWQDLVLPIRVIKDPVDRKAAKEKLPYVTLSGYFSEERRANKITTHSGFIGMDIDGIGNDVESTKSLLSNDPYIFAAFTSVSGNGLCVIFKINPERHLDSFLSIADYLLKQYQIIVDPSGKDVNRARFVSFDPDIHINESALLFKKYLPKEKKRKIVSTIFIQSEFDEVINEMEKRAVSCVEDYRDWIAVGFGLASKFGEQGRRYFHKLSACSSKYDESVCDSQYTLCMRNPPSSEKITIATIYYFAKQAGIDIHSEQTKKITAATTIGKASGLDEKQIAKRLELHEGIKGVDDVIKQVFESPGNYLTADNLIDNIRIWVRHNHAIKRNVITRRLENNGEQMEEKDFNTMFLDAKIIFRDLDFQLFTKVLYSSNTPDYNPIKDLIESVVWDGENRIDQLGASINSATGDLDWRCKMVRKWIVGIIHSLYGGINELNLILVGGKNTGKTQWFRRLLPPELQGYFANSQLNRGKDDEILMCEKLIIFNDEYGGKRKDAEREEKRLMASDYFSLRVPYGRGNETIRRIATLCGSCNEFDVLDDPTGNRRIIVIAAAGKFDFALYNSIDKYQLFAEALYLHRQGERPELSPDEIMQLESTTDGEYSKVSFEGEMVQKRFLPPSKTSPWNHMTTTEIKIHLENYTREKININRLGSQLRKLGYTRKKLNGTYGYDIDPVPVIMPGQ